LAVARQLHPDLAAAHQLKVADAVAAPPGRAVRTLGGSASVLGLISDVPGDPRGGLDLPSIEEAVCCTERAWVIT